MEKFLLKNMTQILFALCGVIFFTWLFQYLDFSFLNPVKIPYLKEYKFEGIISTFQMFTSIGAIFAFWYGYKKYENEKLFGNLNGLINNFGGDKITKTQLTWFSGYILYKKGDLGLVLFKVIENESTNIYIEEILNSPFEEHIDLIIANTLLVFQKNEYIRTQFQDLKNHFNSGLQIIESEKMKLNREYFIKRMNSLENDPNYNFKFRP